MCLDSMPLKTDLNQTEWSLAPPYTHTLLTQLRRDVNVYTTDFVHQHDVLTHALHHALDVPAPRPRRRRKKRRRRRQVGGPDLQMLRGAYTSFLGASRGSPGIEKKNKNRAGGVGGLPVVLVPQEDPTRCVASPHLSTFGFLGFVLNVVNAVINVANNINNNNNNNNNNDNNNNNNDLNINQAQVTQTATNTNAATAMAGRRLHHLKSMRSSIHRHLRRLRHHTRRRRSSPEPCSGEDAVDEAVVAAAALLDMWGRLVTEEEPWCLAWEMCHTAAALAATSRLAADVGRVGTAAAANMIVNFQGVNPEFLVEAAERGADGVNCTEVYGACPDFADVTTTTTTPTVTPSGSTTVNSPH